MSNLSSLSSVQPNQAQATLLVIDVQQGLFKKSTPIYRAETLLANINTLVERAHQAQVPVFYIQHSNKLLVEGTGDWQLHPHLRPAAGDRSLQKQHGSAFQETGLHQELSQDKIRTLVVTGLVTHGCVQATCLEARQLGYRVILVTDGHSNYHRQAAGLIETWHQKLATAGVELQSTAEIRFEANDEF